MTEGIRLSELEKGDCFHTRCLGKIGVLVKRGHLVHEVRWEGSVGIERLHPKLIVDPWPRDGLVVVGGAVNPGVILGGPFLHPEEDDGGPGGW